MNNSKKILNNKSSDNYNNIDEIVGISQRSDFTTLVITLHHLQPSDCHRLPCFLSDNVGAPGLRHFTEITSPACLKSVANDAQKWFEHATSPVFH